MYDPNLNASPINPLPPVVVVLALAVIAPELVIQLASKGFIGGPQGVGWRVSAIEEFGFFERLFDYMVATGEFTPRSLARMLTYPFVHFSLVHAGFATVMILALGKMVAECFSAMSVLVLFAASTIAGALVYGLALDTRFPLIGAYPAVYGLLGAYTWILWLTAGATGESRLKAFRLVGILLALQLGFRVAFGGSNDWVADLGGFATGFTLSFVLAPDGAARIRGWIERLRQR